MIIYVYKWAYLEPDFEVESGAGMASGVEEAKSDAAVDAATDKDGDSEGLGVGHGAREMMIIDIEAV